MVTFVRLGLKIISGDFEEDFTKIVGGVGFQRYLIFENRSNGSKVVCVNKSPTLTRWR